MITQIQQVMLYVNDPEKNVLFWTDKLGFYCQQEMMGPDHTKAYLIKPTRMAQTMLCLMNKETVQKMSPEINLETPSILFSSDDLDQTYIDFKSKGVWVGEIMDVGEFRSFNFCDDQQHYFAISQKKQQTS